MAKANTTSSRRPEPPGKTEAAKAVEKVRKTAAKLAESEKAEPGTCTLCQVCVRMCRDVVGANVLELSKPSADRSTWKIVAAAPENCIGCGACAEVCPTDFIPCETSVSKRVIWNLEFEMLRCSCCGRSHITVAQGDFFAGPSGVPHSYLETCDTCKRNELAATFVRLSLAG